MGEGLVAAAVSVFLLASVLEHCRVAQHVVTKNWRQFLMALIWNFSGHAISD
jgi:hypothetical protein